MDEITVYTVQVHGVVEVQATDPQDAKDKALTYFAASPMSYISILETKTVLVNGTGGP